MFRSTFSNRIREVRVGIGMTQKALGEAAGVSMQNINEIEHGRSTTVIEKAAMLAEALGVSLDYLVGLSDDPRRL